MRPISYLPSAISRQASLRSDNLSANFSTMIRLTAMICGLAMGLLIQANVSAQRDPEAEEFEVLRQEIEKLQAGQRRLQKELGEIKGLLTRGRQRPAPPKFEPTVVDLSNDPIKGKQDARLTLLDFTDYE